jgi:predicted NAD-dependent protein-ADP-ribosyltransferase YbiA (DUF1768 family)
MIRFFERSYRFLAPFYRKDLSYLGIAFKTFEHAYRYAIISKDKPETEYWRHKIRFSQHPAKAFKASVTCPINSDDDAFKISIIRDLVSVKFKERKLAYYLRETNPVAIEYGNHTCDNFLGICHCPVCRGNLGQNWLGKILMEFRSTITQE